MKKRILFIIISMLFIASPVFTEDDLAKGHFDMAVKNYINHSLDGAIEQLKMCLSIDSNYSQARKFLDVVLKKKAAEEELGRGRPAVRPNVGSIVLAEESFNKAVEMYFNNDLYGAYEKVNAALKIIPGHRKANELLSRITDRLESQAVKDRASSITNLLSPDKRREKIKVFFKNEDLGVALRTLSQILGVNIVLPEGIVGKINANFIDTTPEDVFKSILQSTGYVYLIEGSVIRIAKMDEDKLATKAFRLTHTTLSDTQMQKIKDSLSDKSRILYDAKSRTLMITDKYAYIHDIEDMVNRIDTARPQVLIEAKLIEIVGSKIKNLGVKWEQNLYLKVTGAKVPVTFPFTAERAYGLVKDFLPLSKPADAGEIGDFPHDASKTFGYNSKDNFTFGSIESGTLQATLDYLENDDDTNLLSSPRILAIDDEESEILVGSTVPIPTYERNSTTGQMEITGYANQEIGVLLRVTPKIQDDNYVTLTVHPEISAIIGYTGPNNERPITSNRKVSTTLRIKDGDSVVIGGLLTDKEIENIIKLPILGDIPWLGAAFKHKKTTKEKTEVMVFLTVTIIRDDKTTF